jgi:hypothetical protein
MTYGTGRPQHPEPVLRVPTLPVGTVVSDTLHGGRGPWTYPADIPNTPAALSASAFARRSRAPPPRGPRAGAVPPGHRDRPAPRPPRRRPGPRPLACPSPYLLRPPRSLPPSLAFESGPPRLGLPADPPPARPARPRAARSLQIRPDPQ